MGCVSGKTQKQHLPGAAHQPEPSLQGKQQPTGEHVEVTGNNLETKKTEVQQQNSKPEIKNHLEPEKMQLAAPIQSHPNISAELQHEVIEPTSGIQTKAIPKIEIEKQQKKVENLSHQQVRQLIQDAIVKDENLPNGGHKVQEQVVPEQHLIKDQNPIGEVQRMKAQTKQVKEAEELDVVHSEGQTNFRPPALNLNFNVQMS